MRKFHIFVFKLDGCQLWEEKTVIAENMYQARKPFIDRGYPAHSVYALDITK